MNDAAQNELLVKRTRRISQLLGPGPWREKQLAGFPGDVFIMGSLPYYPDKDNVLLECKWLRGDDQVGALCQVPALLTEVVDALDELFTGERNAAEESRKLRQELAEVRSQMVVLRAERDRLRSQTALR